MRVLTDAMQYMSDLQIIRLSRSPELFIALNLFKLLRAGCRVDDGMLAMLCRALRFTKSVTALELDCLRT